MAFSLQQNEIGCCVNIIFWFKQVIRPLKYFSLRSWTPNIPCHTFVSLSHIATVTVCFVTNVFAVPILFIVQFVSYFEKINMVSEMPIPCFLSLHGCYLIIGINGPKCTIPYFPLPNICKYVGWLPDLVLHLYCWVNGCSALKIVSTKLEPAIVAH